MSAPAAQAAAGDLGYRGLSYAGAGNDPTGSKPESKLWWNDGSWWGSLWDTASADFHIFRLNLATQTWVDTGTALDTRANTRADVLWDGSKLYVASHVFTESTGPTTSSNGAKLYRYSYDAGQKRYTLDSGFPVDINAFKSETLVIEKDQAGYLWATWAAQTTASSGVYEVYVNRTTSPVGSGAITWGTPISLASITQPNQVKGATVAKDDISSIVSFGGSMVGVMWSNQKDSAMYFAIHNTADNLTTWQTSRTAIQGPNNADDHINLKSLQVSPDGHVFAAVKTSQSAASAPRIMLLVRQTNGDWTSYVHSRGSDNQTRGIILLDEEHNGLYFYTSDEGGGVVYEKTTPINAISFVSGKGTPFIQDGSSAMLNNVTSTKQNVTCQTGIVILASNNSTKYYWHNYRTLPGCGSPPSDTTPPTVSVTAPANGATVTGASVALTANANDNVAVAGVQFQVDGANVGAEDTSAPYSFTWNSTTVPDGGHSITAVARDAAGNSATSAAIGITVSNVAPPSDTTPPSVSVTAPATGATVSGASVALTANATDNVTVVGVQFQVDGANVGAEDTSAPYSFTWNSTTVPDGGHSITAVARDAAGNSATSAAISVTVSNAAPPTGGTLTVNAAADTYVEQAAPTTSRATGSELQSVGGSTTAKYTFIRFTVSGLPAGAVVDSAKLRLVVTNDSTSGGIFNAITNTSWAETITWNTKPAIDGTQFATLGAVTVSQAVEVTIPAGIISGNGDYSFAITLPAGNTNTLGYASRSASTVASRPQLIITSH